MANRPVFVVNKNDKPFVIEENIDFRWHPGFSKKQKRKSIRSLHNNFLNKSKYKDKKILEVSTKSESELGVKLSAFNLKIDLSGHKVPVECIFQSSKVFEKGGPYKDLLSKTPYEVKKDNRLRNSGSLVSFKLNDQEWPLEPKTLFYDWLYMQALDQNQELVNRVKKYDAFTDIEFNPKKSINCQAKSLALYLSLNNKGIIDDLLNDVDKYIKFFQNNQTKRRLELFD
ncbi:MAG TPA: hypothetical protein VKN74_00950 [Candidatus Mcinerneyibacterium sp.]|nr:hypothetical protein [Candidatus Mcinerneyibacterium sp.]